MKCIRMLLLGLLLWPEVSNAATKILPMRERAEVIDRWLADRIENVLPSLMRRAEIDMWIIISREYNEDPVLSTFLPSTWQSARRTTILMITDRGADQPLETLAVARYDVGDRFVAAWDKETDGEQWAHLAKLVEARNPKRIGLNYSDDFALADGISHTEYQKLYNALPATLHQRLVSAEPLAIGWLESRSEAEMRSYQHIVRIAHDILAEGLSQAAIQPGVTTTSDLQWWYRDRIRELKLTAWFHPSVSIDRRGLDRKTGDGDIIRPGDLLHVDFGITYLRLNTDTQQHAYVLRPGETDAPRDLKTALARANRMQDLLTNEFKAGRTGNDILARTLKKAEREGIRASIYTHPIGYHGHGAGPTIGLWDQQDGVPGKGDYPLYANTAHSIELYAESRIDSWDRSVRIRLEEDAFFDGEVVTYIDGRQKEFLLIPRDALAQ